MIRLASLAHCHEVVFPFIRRSLSAGEPAPVYEQENNGLRGLETVLTLAKNDTYYPTFADKATYLFCGLAGAQHFSNGNKRLAVGVLLLFLVLNEAGIRILSAVEYRELLLKQFPRHAWDDNPSIRGPHALFLYNLATIIGDRPHWGVSDFRDLRRNVRTLFSYIYRVSEE